MLCWMHIYNTFVYCLKFSGINPFIHLFHRKRCNLLFKRTYKYDDEMLTWFARLLDSYKLNFGTFPTSTLCM